MEPQVRLADLATDTLMTLPDAAAYLGRLMGGKKCNVSTVWRWCLKGVKGVRLESICVGGKRFVTTAGLERFIDRRTRAQEPPVVAITIDPRTSPELTRDKNRRRAEIDAARRRLDELAGPPSTNRGQRRRGSTSRSGE